MELLTVLATCNLARDFGLVVGMVMTFSSGDPYVVRAASDIAESPLDVEPQANVSAMPRSREAALADMQRVKRPLVGLLPVPVEWAERYQVTAEDLLEPCTNVSVATAQLSEYERLCGRQRNARSCALHAYAEAAGIEPFEWAVLETLQEHPLQSMARAERVETPAIVGADVFVDAEPPRVRAANSILVFSEAPAPPAAAAQSAKKNSKLKNGTR